jgi:Fe-Mn family superoxide dismutase
MSIETKTDVLKNQIILAEQKDPLLTEMKSIGIENLPYSYASLRKFIDPETMNVHYNKHYKGYVKNLNSALKKLGEDDVDLEKIVKNISRYNTTVRNNAGGAFNHALFWKMLTPEKQNIHGEILKRIRKDFGSYENFKNKFVSTATRKFGSGWCWLVLTKRNTLKIICTSNQDNPLMNIIKNGGYPLLGLDLWEHAYYLKYKNKRDEYVQNFWKVVNWEFVNKLYNDQINREKKEEPKEQIKESRILTEQDSVDPCKGTRFKMVVYNRLSRNQKLNYSKLIFDVFRHKYSSNWKETDRSQGIESGFYDIEQPGRSVLSYANTNYTLMCFLVLMMNKIAKKKGWDNLNLKSEDNATFDKNFNRFLGMLKSFKDEITQDWVMEKILDVLKKQHEKGQATENRFKKVCEEKSNGKVTVELVSGLGNREDFYGIDGYIDFGDGKKSIQIKPFDGYHIDEEGYYVIDKTAAVKKYNTDLMGFISRRDEVLIFKTNNMDISTGKYRFPEENKVEL